MHPNPRRNGRPSPGSAEDRLCGHRGRSARSLGGKPNAAGGRHTTAPRKGCPRPPHALSRSALAPQSAARPHRATVQFAYLPCGGLLRCSPLAREQGSLRHFLFCAGKPLLRESLFLSFPFSFFEEGVAKRHPSLCKGGVARESVRCRATARHPVRCGAPCAHASRRRRLQR